MKDGKITLEKVDQKTPAAASGFIFNTRRPIFEDPRVREALIMAFDFEWANANLFNNAYHRTYGYYGGSELSSEGKPVDDAEKEVLGDALGKLRPDFVDGSYKLPVSDGSGRDRKILRKAVGLLAEAGWTVTDKGLVNAKGEALHLHHPRQGPGPGEDRAALPAHAAGHRHHGQCAHHRLLRSSLSMQNSAMTTT